MKPEHRVAQEEQRFHVARILRQHCFSACLGLFEPSGHREKFSGRDLKIGFIRHQIRQAGRLSCGGRQVARFGKRFGEAESRLIEFRVQFQCGFDWEIARS